jgi:2,3-bisphosphoglycerate-independent phosphoglycerate mutase
MRDHEPREDTAGSKRVVLLIMDGVGIGRQDGFDAVDLARTPRLDELERNGLHRRLVAHGTAVGLPSDDDMGNSEVGHNILGAGRIFPQGAKRVKDAFDSQEIWKTEVWTSLVARCRAGGTLHLLGLLSDGGVHSNISHLFEIIDRAVSEGVGTIRLHVLFDGRDVPDRTAEKYLREVRDHIGEHPDCDIEIASGGGRMTTTMDRYGADWTIVERGWDAHVRGIAQLVDSAEQGVELGRTAPGGGSDQTLPAFTVRASSGEPVGAMRDGDAVLLFNFRGDRAMEIVEAFESSHFANFDRGVVPDVYLAGMCLYDGDTSLPTNYLVGAATIDETVSELIARAGLGQFACAETQKFGHVTYFWNGNRSDKFDDATETYVEIASDPPPFDHRPWMKSAETADEVIAAVDSGRYSFIRANFAGGDMVGHSGELIPSILAVESIDLAIGRIHDVCRRGAVDLVVTADHGNADDMVQRDDAGSPLIGNDGAAVPRTAHSLNAVPLLIAPAPGRDLELRDELDDAGLANVGATLLDLLGLPVPESYEPSLVVTNDQDADEFAAQ